MRVPITKDLLSGLLFIAIGGGATIVALNYKLGGAMRVGPGLFPIMLGVIISLIGVAVAVRALRHPETSSEIASWEVKPLAFVLLAIVAFSLLISSWGLIPAIVAVVLIGHFASREASIVELVCITGGLCVLSSVIFVYGLKIPIPLGFW